jgi:hypothetical protein
MRRLTVLATAVLAFACSKSSKPAKPPAMSPDIDVSGVIVGPEASPGQPLESDGREITVGFDGTSYLVVWTQLGVGGSDDLYGARMTAAGEPIGDPFPIVTAAGPQETPAIAFDGQDWLVVFQDRRAGAYLSIYGVRVRADGTVLDAGGFAIVTQIDPTSSTLVRQARPAVAFDGTNYLVVWADRRSARSWDIYGSLVTREGTVLNAGGFPVSAGATNEVSPAVAFDGTNYLVAWQDSRGSGGDDVYAARVTPAATLLDAGGFAVSAAGSTQGAPAVSFDGQEYVVAWEDFRTGTSPSVYAARVTKAGAVKSGSEVALKTAAAGQRAPATAFDGAYTLVVWADASFVTTSVAGGRLDAAAGVLDAGGFLVASETMGQSLAVASDGAGHALVAYDAIDSATGAVRVRGRVLTDWAALSVSKTGRGGGTVASTPEGIDCGDACSHRFDAPTEVTLGATPDGDSVFGGWSGACTGMGSCSVTTDASKSVTALFRALYPLTVDFGGGPTGNVTSQPAGIECGSTCAYRFPEGEHVDLTAAGTPGYSLFKAWSGGDCGVQAAVIDPQGRGFCGFQVDGPTTRTATFVRASTVTFAATGTGAGTIAYGWFHTVSGLSGGDTSCAVGANPSCRRDFETGATAEFRAEPAAGSVRKGWTGCTPQWFDETYCSTPVTGPRYVSVKFEPATIPLTAITSGSGSGTVTGAGLSCTTGSTAGCTTAVANPTGTSYTTVTLTATPSAGSVFKSWSGCAAVAGAPNTCTVTVSSARNVYAKFEPSTIPLTAVTTGTGSGTVTGAGLACTTGSTAGCTAAVPNPADSSGYTTVTLTATASPGSVFKAWTSCAVGGDPSTCTAVVSGAKTVYAKFEPDAVALNAGTTGSGSGTISGAGLACTTGSSAGCTAAVPNPPFTTGYATVTLTATPGPGSVFKSWSGCAPVDGAPSTCTTTATPGKTVTAKFEPAGLPLTAATTGNGGGTVTGAGLACTTGSTAGCTALVPNPPDSATYATVTLTATGDASSVFKSWTGCSQVAGTNTCTLVVNGAESVSAKFEPNTVPIAASTTGTGSGTITGAGLSCTTGSSDGCVGAAPNPPNTSGYGTVIVTATPSPGSVFKSWSGCTPVSGAPTTCEVLASPGRAVSAKFEPDAIALSATTTGTGSGTVSGAGLDCTTGSIDGCTALVPNPNGTAAYTTVTLTATPAAGSVFKSWTGCTAVAGTNTCTITVNAARTVSAKFEPNAISLSAVTSGTGAGTVSGAGLACTTGSTDGCTTLVPNPDDTSSYEVVTLTATPAAGSVFKSWSGCTAVAGTSTCTVTVNAAKTVTARFEPSTMPLTVVTAGTGAGTVTGPGLSCTTGSSDGCTAQIENPANTSGYGFVTLTATASAGSTFRYWSNCTPATDAPWTCSVLVNSAKTVTATFNVQ